MDNQYTDEFLEFLEFIADVEENENLGTLSNIEVLLIQALRKDFKYALRVLTIGQTKLKGKNYETSNN